MEDRLRARQVQMIHDVCLVVYVCGWYTPTRAKSSGVVSTFLIAQMMWCIIILAITLAI